MILEREVTCKGILRTPHEHVAGGGKFVWARRCRFEGMEDVTVDFRNHTATWECPTCGTVQEYPWDDLPDPEPDPDRMRDDWLDRFGGDVA